MNDFDRALARIRAFVGTKSNRELWRLTGLAPNTFRCVRSPDGRPWPGTLSMIADVIPADFQPTDDDLARHLYKPPSRRRADKPVLSEVAQKCARQSTEAVPKKAQQDAPYLRVACR